MKNNNDSTQPNISFEGYARENSSSPNSNPAPAKINTNYTPPKAKVTPTTKLTPSNTNKTKLIDDLVEVRERQVLSNLVFDEILTQPNKVQNSNKIQQRKKSA